MEKWQERNIWNAMIARVNYSCQKEAVAQKDIVYTSGIKEACTINVIETFLN